MTNGKLVRDGISGIFRATGVEPVVHTLEGEALIDALCEKLLEEIEELRTATTNQQAEELADLLEVIRGLALHLGVDFAEVEEIAATKLSGRCGFARGFGWLSEPRRSKESPTSNIRRCSTPAHVPALAPVR